MSTTFPILDLILGMVFIYFLLSVMMNSALEIFLSISKMRASILQEWLVQTFKTNETAITNLGKDIMNHSSIAGLTAKDKSPSYISASNFAYVLIEKLTVDLKNPQQLVTNMSQMINLLSTTSLLPPDIASTFITYANEVKQTPIKAKSEIELFREKIEDWFDQSMQRLTGNLKRITLPLGYVISAIIVGALNIDSIQLANYLYQNPTVTTQLANQAELETKSQAVINQVAQFKKDLPAQPVANYVGKMIGDSATDSTSKKLAVAKDTTVLRDSASNAGEVATLDSLVRDQLNAIKGAKSALGATSLPIGWKTAAENKNRSDMNDGGKIGWYWLLKILGLILTTLAAGMGAPFWFDVMNKIANLRGTGGKPDTAAATRE